ncbi:unnamed protein product [Spirodela intermedia]|uniref:Uncharacterized protein n=1 Tax=Spirodela intermedia TaxID=51605 RepID=A0A7I8L2V1_SPIIN|nr:unnamed protein product [Spirodela intermedia]
MERMLRSRDHILFGHASLFRLSSEEEGDVSRRSTDVDFSDVFGGPPRTSSGFEGRHGFSESIDGYLSRVRGDGVEGGEEVAVPRRPRSTSHVENPASGGTGSPGHRKHLTNEFFGDVFKGNESMSSSPRTDGPSASSASSAAALSPSHPPPPTIDGLSGGSSLAAETSSVQGSDHAGFISPNKDIGDKTEKSVQDLSSLHAPANARRSARTKNYPRSVNRPSIYKIPPHLQRLNSPQTPLEAIKLDRSGANETEQGYKEDSGRSSYSGGGHFHFSIYKWASTEIALVMPHNLKNRNKSASRVCGGSAKNLQGATPLVDSQTASQEGRTSHTLSKESVSQFNGLSAAGDLDMRLKKDAKKVLPASSAAKSDINDVHDKSETKPNPPISALDEIATHGKYGGSKFSVESLNPVLQDLHHQVKDKEGVEETGTQARKRKSFIYNYTGKLKDTLNIGHTTKENTMSYHAEKGGQTKHLAHVTLEGQGSGLANNVKDFIKIFNNEASQRPTAKFESQTQKLRTRNEDKGRLKDHTGGNVANTVEVEEKVVDERWSTPMARTFASLNCIFVNDALDVSFCNIDEEYLENIDGCLVEELSQNQNKVSEADVYREKIQASDAKIREWSKGKEGNIRSLLSTLQYVLWPGSGWKTVPLVDIIEAAAVRRAYQKALLCLHPDKLQQKGTEMHHKYVAEKVFDILQYVSMVAVPIGSLATEPGGGGTCHCRSQSLGLA